MRFRYFLGRGLFFLHMVKIRWRRTKKKLLADSVRRQQLSNYSIVF